MPSRLQPSYLYRHYLSLLLSHHDFSALSGKRIFISGGTGFVGTWLLYASLLLNERSVNFDITVLSRDPHKFIKKHPILGNQPWLNFIKGDVKTFKYPNANFEFIIHAATETSKSAHSNHGAMLENIIFGTQNICDFARQSNVRKVLMISSGAVYGSQPYDLPLQQEFSALACDPFKPQSSYGEGKRVMELMGAILAKEAGIESLSARCFSFCGPGLPVSGHYAFGNFIRDAMLNNEIIINGDGSTIRSYLFGADMAMWLLILLLRGKSGEPYNVGSDKPLTTFELAKRIQSLVAPHKKIRVLGQKNKQIDKVDRYVPDVSKSKTLGCQIWTNLDEGILSTAEYCKQSGV
jgi:nucleoside-diphosphate-sugar epimerase